MPEDVPAVVAPAAKLAEPRVNKTRDLASLTVGEHPVDAAMGHAFAVKRFTAPGLVAGGNAVHRVKMNDAGAQSAVESALMAGIDWLVRGKHVEVERFASEDDGDTINVVCTYRNLRTGEQRTVKRKL